MAKISKLTMLPLILVAICVINRPADADTSVYVFDSDQSIVVKTGGFAGVHETYDVTGQFRLSVDSDTSIALFETVEANLADETGAVYGQSLNEIFNMTGLTDTVIDEMTIEFAGKTTDGTESDVRLKLSFSNDLASITGQTTPPPNSADMFFYDVNAVAVKKYASGTGEPNNPYLISTAGQLNAIGAEPGDWDKHFKLTADIDLQEYSGEQFNIIGTMRDKFIGSFDGAGFTISNFRYSAGNINFIGLFSQVGDGAQIKDVMLDNVEIEVEKGSSVGALVGFNLRGIISCCSVSGSVIGGDGSGNLGALVGFNSRGTVSSCIASGSVTGANNISSIGGLVGNNAYGEIYDCMATTTVSGGPGSSDIGGLVGYSEAGTISNSLAAGNVSGDTSLGGLVGYKNDGSIIQCYAIGDVSGNTPLGGLVGRNDSGIISDCYATGSVDGDDALGGLVGRNHKGSVSYCYAAGTVNGNSRLGGLVGNEDRGSYIGSFWDTDVNPGLAGAGDIDPDPNDIFGKTTAEMQTVSTFLEAGWDFVDETENGTEDVWKIEDLGYPRLWWEKYGGGMGEPNNPYLICTAEHLKALGDETNDYGKHFKLMADIDLGDYAPDQFNFIGESIPFNGVFDGNGHSISNFHYSDGDRSPLSGGLFSMVADPNAQIRNLTLIDPNISGKVHVGPLVGWMQEGAIINCHVIGGCVNAVFPALVTDHIGGLVGQVDRGAITSCTSSCRVNGHNSVGGLIGYAGKTDGGGCFITNCRATGDVTGESLVGGLVGIGPHSIIICSYATGQVVGGWQVGGLLGSSGGGVTGRYITDCYATGSVAGKHAVGGLIGTHGNIPISRCYAAGEVINLSDEPDTSQHYIGGLIGSENRADSTCFWDIETTGQTTSKGGIGKTTAEMQMASTFLEVGWDFVGETDNGTEDIWWILEGQDYPRLWWEADNN